MKHFAMLILVCALWGPGARAFGADSGKPIVESISHVGLAISDLKTALHFYIDQLGLQEAFPIKRPDGTTDHLNLRVGDSDTFVELFPGRITPTSAGTTTVNHLGLFVKDLQATLHALKDRGYPLPDDAFEKAKKVSRDHCFIYFIKDPDGNKIELSQLRPDSLQITSRNKK